MTRAELENALALPKLTTRELREAERLLAKGKTPPYIRGWLKVGRA